jgi:hypothetical protein
MNMRRSVLAVLAGVVLLAVTLVPSRALAANLWCSGTVSSVYVDRYGGVVIYGDWRGDYLGLCNMTTGLNGIDAMTCASWLAFATKASTSGLSVMLMYDIPAGTTCGTLGTYWASPPPSYLMLL